MTLQAINLSLSSQQLWLLATGLLLALLLTIAVTAWLARRKLIQQLASQAEENRQLQQLGDHLSQEKHQQEEELTALHSRHGLLERRWDLVNAEKGHLQQRCQELHSKEKALAQQQQDLLTTRQMALAEIQGQKERINGQGVKIAELHEQVQHWQAKWEGQRDINAALSEEKIRQSSSLAEQQRSLDSQQALFEQQKQDLTHRFQVLANDILEKKSTALSERSQDSLQSVINPFKSKLEDFRKEVQDIHHREISQRSELKKELHQLKELNQQITAEAHELSTALKGQKKLQGNWGELVLENVLERSGLQLGHDFQREVSFTGEQGRQRPDVVVYLPGNKHLIIDSKVSLNAYTRYVNSEDKTERRQALAEHVGAMGDRIQELSERDYYKITELNSPEVVFMFVPIESAFVEALKADENLLQTALEKNVLVATPTTLLASLNIVRQLWRVEDQNKHTLALAQKAEGVFNKLNGFLKSFENVKKGLDKASEAYSKAEGQLISGKGNLVKQVGEFKNLAPAIKQELPAELLEKANLEVNYQVGKNEPEQSGQSSPVAGEQAAANDLQD